VSQALTHVRPARRWATPGGLMQLAVIPKVGAGWGSASRPDLCRGCRVTGIPTALQRLTTAVVVLALASHEPAARCPESGDGRMAWRAGHARVSVRASAHGWTQGRALLDGSAEALSGLHKDSRKNGHDLSTHGNGVAFRLYQ